MAAAASPYAVRRQAVTGAAGTVLVAVFPLEGGGAACLQLQDEGALRRGGVYLLAEDDPAAPGVAPRFEELFGELAAKARDPRLRAALERLLREGQAAAVATRPRLDPPALERLLAVGRAAARLDRRRARPAPGALSIEATVVACTLIFVSEEERYPPPRWRGSLVALETLLEVLGASNPSRGNAPPG
ncbi:MAG: hypothetical protein M9894_19465 [Planctomycetes bacterium]|nr:hypothetical protein [Planctomycetota bacterium]